QAGLDVATHGRQASPRRGLGDLGQGVLGAAGGRQGGSPAIRVGRRLVAGLAGEPLGPRAGRRPPRHAGPAPPGPPSPPPPAPPPPAARGATPGAAGPPASRRRARSPPARVCASTRASSDARSRSCTPAR